MSDRAHAVRQTNIRLGSTRFGKGTGVMDETPQPLRRALFSARYLIPAVLVLTGLACLFVAPEGQAVQGWALFTGAGTAVLLLNLLYRIGVQGDLERDREARARDYFDEHGRWPDEPARKARREPGHER